jgi:hypothetical protein
MAIADANSTSTSPRLIAITATPMSEHSSHGSRSAASRPIRVKKTPMSIVITAMSASVPPSFSNAR